MISSERIEDILDLELSSDLYHIQQQCEADMCPYVVIREYSNICDNWEIYGIDCADYQDTAYIADQCVNSFGGSLIWDCDNDYSGCEANIYETELDCEGAADEINTYNLGVINDYDGESAEEIIDCSSCMHTTEDPETTETDVSTSLVSTDITDSTTTQDEENDTSTTRIPEKSNSGNGIFIGCMYYLFIASFAVYFVM